MTTAAARDRIHIFVDLSNLEITMDKQLGARFYFDWTILPGWLARQAAEVGQLPGAYYVGTHVYASYDPAQTESGFVPPLAHHVPRSAAGSAGRREGTHPSPRSSKVYSMPHRHRALPCLWPRSSRHAGEGHRYCHRDRHDRARMGGRLRRRSPGVVGQRLHPRSGAPLEAAACGSSRLASRTQATPSLPRAGRRLTRSSTAAMSSNVYPRPGGPTNEHTASRSRSLAFCRQDQAARRHML